MNFEDEVTELTGIESVSWTYHPDADGYDANVWFDWTPSEDKPEGQPVPFDALKALDDEYGVVSVGSHSSGETGSKLCVKLESL